MNLDRETIRNAKEKEKWRTTDMRHNYIYLVTQHHLSSVKCSSVPFLQSLRQIRAEFHIIAF